MNEMITARIDYEALDQPDEDVRIRLNSTVTNVAEVQDNHGANVRIRYATGGQLFDVYGKTAFSLVTTGSFRIFVRRCLPSRKRPSRKASRDPWYTPTCWFEIGTR